LHVLLGPEDGLREASAVNLDTIQSVRLNTLGSFIAQLAADRMREVAAAIRYTFDLDVLEG
jgi:mRNA-degrading endonuclease toxin of MazEF toxin-antitoxin module